MGDLTIPLLFACAVVAFYLMQSPPALPPTLPIDVHQRVFKKIKLLPKVKDNGLFKHVDDPYPLPRDGGDEPKLSDRRAGGLDVHHNGSLSQITQCNSGTDDECA
jgi:hypothetical protein